jgi:hypothetical protein
LVVAVGQVYIDKTAPATPATVDRMACEGWPASFSITLPVVTDDVSATVSYDLVVSPTYGTLSGCLDGTDSVDCTFTWGGELPPNPDDTFEYTVTDESGNVSGNAVVNIDAVVCM